MSDTTLATLTQIELSKLEQYESRISEGLTSFIDTGDALLAIRDGRLYRATHRTFEDYCREKWNMTKRHANRMIEAAEVVGPIGPKSEIRTESQARELARVEPEKRDEVVKAALENTGGKITAKALREAAVELVEEQSDETSDTDTDGGRINKARAEKYIQPSAAMMIASGAIEHLKGISQSDPHRREAMQYVSKWIAKQLSL